MPNRFALPLLRVKIVSGLDHCLLAVSGDIKWFVVTLLVIFRNNFLYTSATGDDDAQVVSTVPTRKRSITKRPLRN